MRAEADSECMERMAECSIGRPAGAFASMILTDLCAECNFEKVIGNGIDKLVEMHWCHHWSR